jgi:hypothetical protein
MKKWESMDIWQLEVKRDTLENYIESLDDIRDGYEDDPDFDRDEYDLNVKLLGELNDYINHRRAKEATDESAV